MGISGLLQLLKSITFDRHISAFSEKRIAIDTYCWIHKAIYSCAFELVTGGSPDRFYEYCCKRVETFLQYNIKLVMVFDGGPLPCKAHVENQREKFRQAAKIKAFEHLKKGEIELASKNFAVAIDVTPSIAHKLLRIFREKYHLECIVAPYEADAQLAYLNRSGYVDYVLTEDSDLMAFGAKRVLYKLDAQGNCKEICSGEIGNAKDLGTTFTREMFISACILSGCDYLEAIPRIGSRTAFRLVSEKKQIHGILQSLRRDAKFTVPEHYEKEFERAFLTFHYQWVYCPVNMKLVNLNIVDFESIKKRLKSDPKKVPIEERLLYKYGSIENCSFLGKFIEDGTAVSIAYGDLDPITHKPYDENDLQCEVDVDILNEKIRLEGIDKISSEIEEYRKSGLTFDDIKVLRTTMLEPSNEISKKGKGFGLPEKKVKPSFDITDESAKFISMNFKLPEGFLEKLEASLKLPMAKNESLNYENTRKAKEMLEAFVVSS